MKSTIQVLDAVENIRRAQRAGVFAPHKPLLILLALARVQRGATRLVEVSASDDTLGHLPAGLETAHIRWHHVGGPDIEPNGLSGELQFQGQPIHAPQHGDLRPALFCVCQWNRSAPIAWS